MRATAAGATVLAVLLAAPVGARAASTTWSGSLVRDLQADPSGETLQLSATVNSPTDNLTFGLYTAGYAVTSATLTAYTGTGPINAGSANSCVPDRGDSPETPSGNAGFVCTFDYQQVSAVTVTITTSPCFPALSTGGEAAAGQGPESQIAGPTQACPTPCGSQQQAVQKAQASLGTAQDRVARDLRSLLGADRAFQRAGTSLSKDSASPAAFRRQLKIWERRLAQRDADLRRIAADRSPLAQALDALQSAQAALASCQHGSGSPASATCAGGVHDLAAVARLSMLRQLGRRVAGQSRAGNLHAAARELAGLATRLRREQRMVKRGLSTLAGCAS